MISIVNETPSCSTKQLRCREQIHRYAVALSVVRYIVFASPLLPKHQQDLPGPIPSYGPMPQIFQEEQRVTASMRTVSLIINARWVVPVIPKDTVYDFYSVIIDGKEIIDCLPTKVIHIPAALIS